MELRDCSHRVQNITERFKRSAHGQGYGWEEFKKYFWIRCADGTEVLQGNFETDWVRGFMHGLQLGELQRLRSAKPYKSHCGLGDGHSFRIESESDVEIVKAIVFKRCASTT